MKLLVFFLFLFSCSDVVKAQTISDSYFKVRSQYWSEAFKNSLKKNNLDKDTSFNDLLKNGASQEQKILKHLFDEYLKRNGKNLDTVNSIFFLKKKVQMRSEIVIWNSKDTVYTQIELFIPNIKDPKKISLYSFNNKQINLERNYLIDVMNMVSKVQAKDIQIAIDEKTLDKNGKVRLILDGSHFELYVFKKNEEQYEVNKFLFSNPKFK